MEGVVMRVPNGFGKNYFSLSAIQSYTVAKTLHARASSFHAYFCQKNSSSDEEFEESESPPQLLEESFFSHPKPCHCNCYFTLKTRLMLFLHIYIPRCPYYTTCFAFRRTGVHPPFASLISHK